jgi:hypothetical protein
MQKETTQLSKTNEVLIKNRIAPKYIRGLVVRSDEQKEMLCEKLKKLGLAKQDSLSNTEYFMVNGKKLDDFIHVKELNDCLDKSMWKKN